MKNKDGKQLAAYVEQHLELLTNHLLAHPKLAHREGLRPLISRWLINQVACYGGKPYRAGEWTSQTVEHFMNSGAGLDEARRIFRLCRNEMIACCLDKVPGLSDREIYDLILNASDIHENHLDEHCAQRAQEQEASERRKGAMIVEAVMRPLALLNAQGYIETANLSFARCWGGASESLVGRDMLALCDSETATRMKTALRHKSAGKQLKSFGGVLQNGKKQIKGHFFVQPLFDSGGVRSGAALCLETDGTDEDEILDGIRYMEDCLLGAIPFPVQMLTDDGTVSYSSDAVKTIATAEYDGKEALCCFLYRSRYGAQRPCPCRHAFETGQFFMEELCYPGAGETRWYLLLILPVPDKNGKISRAISCVYDMTRRKQIQKQLETEIIVQQRSSLMAQVAVTVAHQLRNPLSVVLGFAEMMAKGLPPEQAVEAVSRILRNALRCKDIVESLLDFGKGMPLERRVLDFSMLVRESARPMLTPSQNNIIEWRLTEEPTPIECVPEQLTQVVLSLLDNALRAAQSRVVCTLEAKGEVTRLRVADDGPGIPLEMHERIFEPFYTSRRSEGAVGLGLSLARAVANDYGGSLTITSAIGKEPDGACLVLQLPLLKRPADSGGDAAPASVVAESATSYKVLVVDDEADLLELLQTALYMRGYKVETVSSGAEAIEKIEAEVYDAVVLDYQLSGTLSGADVYEHIVDRSPQMKDRILFITADTMNYKTRLFIEGTGRPVIEKPFLTADLAVELKKVITP